jgi:lipoate-protein ligase A
MLDCDVFFSSRIFTVDADTELFRALEETGTAETIHFWESLQPAVVLGALGNARRDVHEDACKKDKVPITHRLSGGGAVVIAQGCLNYSFLLSLESRPALRDVEFSYRTILGRIVDALSVPSLAICGTSDLAVGNYKISGNAQRRGRRALLHHGTVLYDFDVGFMERYLKQPERQPAYRAGRSHSAFVANIALSPDTIKERITRAWNTLKRDA